MQFKHPEILYALLLLIIPILVHLFQLQKFVKVPFTNVKFLKKIEQQSRKSAKLKKWLVLITRMLVFASLIIAFSQPFIANTSGLQNTNTIIYLDNSFSMQAKGEQGELLKFAIQKIVDLNNLPNHNLTVITNNKVFKDLNTKQLKNELLTIKNYPIHQNLNTVLLKVNTLKEKSKNSSNNYILISDYQYFNTIDSISFLNVNESVTLLKLKPNKIINFYIDSVYIHTKTSTEIKLKVLLKSTTKSSQSIPVSLFENKKLIGKSISYFKNSTNSVVEFTIPYSINFTGKITLNDNALDFDNTFYFTISKPEKINVLSIGKPAKFLEKIYTKDEFNYTSTILEKLNFNSIQKQHLILLNEVDVISTELINSLSEFSKNGGNIVVIPSQNAQLNSYNSLLNKLNVGKIKSKVEGERKITSIKFKHPLISDVFEKEITNFQYPKTAFYFQTTFHNASSVINLDNNASFITASKTNNTNFYWISSPLNSKTSNFTKSPLVVPIFYNFGKNSLKFSELYYTITSKTSFDVKTTIEKDNVLEIAGDFTNFIPLQKVSQNKVTIQLQDNILKSGFYQIRNNTKTIKTIAFNYNRLESELNYANLEALGGNSNNISIASSIDTVFDNLTNQQKINWLFKWFLAISVVFLLLEMLLLKYFKL